MATWQPLSNADVGASGGFSKCFSEDGGWSEDFLEAKRDGALLAKADARHRVCLCFYFLTSGQRSADKHQRFAE